VLTSLVAHYSIRKAADLQQISYEDLPVKCPKCGDRIHGIELIHTDVAGRIKINHLEKRVRNLHSNGLQKFIIVLTEGTTVSGSVDDTAAVGNLIKRLQSELKGACFYLHVDAAFGGFVLPFLSGERKYSFYVHQVDSVTIDPHKMGLTPYPAGMFIYRSNKRKNLRKLAGVREDYVPGTHGKDGTMCGSRPGASAAACWAVMKYLGPEGYQRVVDICMKNVEYMKKKLIQFPELGLIPNDMNVVSFFLKDKGNEDPLGDFRKKVKLPTHILPVGFGDFKEPQLVYRTVVMPHVSINMINRFINRLRVELDRLK